MQSMKAGTKTFCKGGLMDKNETAKAKTNHHGDVAGGKAGMPAGAKKPGVGSNKLLALILIIIVAAAIAFVFFGNAPKGRQAQAGDTVTLDYIIRGANGTVLDTNIESIARNFGIYSKDLTYQHFTLKLSPGNGMVAGFTDNIINMTAGQTKRFSLNSSEAYPYDPTQVFELPRESVVPRTATAVLTPAEMSALKIAAGSTVTNKKYGWKMTVINVMPDGKTVVFRQNPSINQYFINDGGWPLVVSNFTDSDITLRLLPGINATYAYTDATSCKTGIAKVISEDNSSVMVDCNNPLAGKDLEFEVNLISIANSTAQQ